jgi:hypothetical protein
VLVQFDDGTMRELSGRVINRVGDEVMSDQARYGN